MPADWSRAIRLRTVEFTACWAALELGEELPVQFGLRPPGATIVERDRRHRDALAGLRGRGLADDHGRPEPRLAGLLRILARPRWDCDLVTDAGFGSMVVVGAAGTDAEGGVVVRQSTAGDAREPRIGTDELWLLPTSGPRVPGTLVELLEPLRPGRARAANIPAADLDAAARGVTDPWTLADRLAERGIDRGEAGSLARMLTGVTGGGQLGASGFPGGVRRRAPWIVGFHRTGDRAAPQDFLQLRRPTPYGATVTVAPASGRLLFTHLTELLRDAQSA